MEVIIKGAHIGDPSDPLIAIPGAPLEHQIINGPVARHRREDLQLQSFLLMLGLSHDSGSSVEVLVGNDPPDRQVRISDETISVELTELTFPKVRRDFALIRKFARRIDEALQANFDDYTHLTGHCVQLTFLPTCSLPRDTNSIFAGIISTLKVDKGYIGEDLEGLQELPQNYPSSRRGMHGTFGPVVVQVNRSEATNQILVRGTTQAEFLQSELVSAICKRIREKDIAANDVLLISCGLPDEKGCICPIDKYMFEEACNIIGTLDVKPDHLKSVCLHLWGTVEVLSLYRSVDYPYKWPPKLPVSLFHK